MGDQSIEFWPDLCRHLTDPSTSIDDRDVYVRHELVPAREEEVIIYMTRSARASASVRVRA